MKTRKVARVNIRPDAYALYQGRELGYDLYVRGEYVGGFKALWEATRYADELLSGEAELDSMSLDAIIG